MNVDIKELLQKELLLNEKILWQGSPRIWKIFSKKDLSFIPFFILMVPMIKMSESLDMIGAFFIILGLFFIYDRLIVRRLRRQRTAYIITNMRILTIVATHYGLTESVSSLEIKSAPEESVSYGRNGFGTITFGTIPLWHLLKRSSEVDSVPDGVVAFWDIEDCEYVLNLYRNIKYPGRSFDSAE